MFVCVSEVSGNVQGSHQIIKCQMIMMMFKWILKVSMSLKKNNSVYYLKMVSFSYICNWYLCSGWIFGLIILWIWKCNTNYCESKQMFVTVAIKLYVWWSHFQWFHKDVSFHFVLHDLRPITNSFLNSNDTWILDINWVTK